QRGHTVVPCALGSGRSRSSKSHSWQAVSAPLPADIEHPVCESAREKHRRSSVLVPRVGLEPTRLATPEPKSGASTNFATWAQPASLAVPGIIQTPSHPPVLAWHGPSVQPAPNRGIEMQLALRHDGLQRILPTLMAVDHYENFPVASFLLPAHLREAVAAIYYFARTADDIADEGKLGAEERPAGLARYQQGLHNVEPGRSDPDPIFQRLGRAVQAHELQIPLLRDLLDAVAQDVHKQRY